MIRAHRTLPCSINIAWDALHDPAVFRYASWPLTVFTTTKTPLPARFTAGQEYEVMVWGAGIIPMGRQIIRLVDEEVSDRQRTLADVGEGVSGVLSCLRDWTHEMALTGRDDGLTDFRDTLSLRAGPLTPLLWPAMQMLWWWRGYRLSRKLRQLAQRAHGSER